jgi:hypothetical protein
LAVKIIFTKCFFADSTFLKKCWVILGLAIDKVDFEKCKPVRSLGDRILDFLAMNKGKAYFEDDIGIEMMQADGGDPILQALTTVGRQAVVLAALDNLIREGRILARISGKMSYYMHNDQAAESGLLVAARELGIATEGKTKQEIAKEIAAKSPK